MKSRCGLVRARKFISSPSIARSVANMVGTSQRDVHGEAAVLAREIQNLKQNAMTGSRLLPGEITADFSKGALLPRLIDGLEKLA